MSRIPPLSPAQMNESQRRICDEILRTRSGAWFHGPYDALLLQPSLAAPAQELGRFVRFDTSLEPRLSELAILIVARHWDCDFEWHQHAPLATHAGISAADVEALRAGVKPPTLKDDEHVVLHFVTSLLKQHRITDSDYHKAQTLLSVVGVVELTGLIGYYTFLAFTLLAHEISLPEGAEPPVRPSGSSASGS